MYHFHLYNYPVTADNSGELIHMRILENTKVYGQPANKIQLRSKKIISFVL